MSEEDGEVFTKNQTPRELAAIVKAGLDAYRTLLDADAISDAERGRLHAGSDARVNGKLALERLLAIVEPVGAILVTPSEEQYPILDPLELEPFYSRHVMAMTAEGLHSKAAIAEQLAWRDQTLAALRGCVARALATHQWEKLDDARRYLGDVR